MRLTVEVICRPGGEVYWMDKRLARGGHSMLPVLGCKWAADPAGPNCHNKLGIGCLKVRHEQPLFDSVENYGKPRSQPTE